MSSIGLDFGTTYSIITYLDNDELKDYYPNQAASPNQHSLVALRFKANKFDFGAMARNRVGRKGYIIYKGFKMMLAEKDEKVLSERGYTEEFTPVRITEEYLSFLINNYSTNIGIEEIDNLVVGVPEIWFEDTATIDSRTALKDILERLKKHDGKSLVRRAKLVSEPAAACAYFVENYKQNKNEDFAGMILLVDYGGGTLDIALCEVEQDNGNSQVSVRKRNGAGLNEQGYIGKAGIAFMEDVVKRTLKLHNTECNDNEDFHRAFDSLEVSLMNNMDTIMEVFEFNTLTDIESIDEEFDRFEYGEDEYVITYGILAQSYNEVIYPVLEEKINEIISYMHDNGIEYGANTDYNFKIALVGGFSNFYLTRRQIEEKFQKATLDNRFTDIINSRRDCEKAISYGATLIAKDKITFIQRSPYYLGIAKPDTRQSNKAGYDYFFAIKKGDEIVFNEPYFVKNINDESDAYFIGTSIPYIALCFDDDMDNILCQRPVVEYQSSLQLEATGKCRIGFSLDESMIITLHQHVEIEKSDGKIDEKIIKKRLDDIYSLFGGLIQVR